MLWMNEKINEFLEQLLLIVNEQLLWAITTMMSMKERS